jgi:NADPH:quinone reductase-like Zn-dependent oxidoreductase
VKAAIVERYGGPEVLKIRDLPIPRPGPAEVLVRVRAFGLNFADIIARWGVYPGTPKPPFVPGLEFAGEIVALGSKVARFSGRERVMGYSRLGSHAEFLVLDERLAARIPENMSFEQAAAFPVASMTAYHGLVTLAGLRKGERLLIHAAAGGVGTATVQLARHLGAEVFGTAGSDEKLRVAAKAGAHHLINYRTDDFAEAIRRVTNGYGVDVVMDSVGGRVFRKSWTLLAGMGRYILYGLSSVSGSGRLNLLRAIRVYGEMGVLVPAGLISRNRMFSGFNLGTLFGKEEYFEEAGNVLLRLWKEGVLNPVIGKVFQFSDIVHAHRELQMGRTFGKVVVVHAEKDAT